MQLRRIEVRAFRKLRHVVVDGLGTGLNVIVGDNEAGKSTLLAALRAVLFERHRVGGKVLEGMLPHGGGVRPEILVDFALGGAPFRLRKAFNQRPEAELVLPTGQTVTGDAVEDRLADLLGFAASAGRGSRPDEHQGIYGLLWVDQGLAHQPLTAGAGRESLAAALEHEVGHVLGGERGRQLLARADERRETFWDKREKPRGAFRQLGDSIEALEAQRGALASRLARHESQEATLAATTDELARIAREGRLAAAVQATSEAARRLAEAEQLRASVDELRRADARARFDRDAAADRVLGRRAAIERAGRAETAATRTAATAAQATTVLQRAAAAADAALATHASARARARAAEAEAEALGRRRERANAQAERARLTRVLAEVADLLARRETVRTALAAPGVTAAALADLDRRCAARDQARVQRDAASVRIVADAAATATILVDGVPHPTGAPLLLDADAVLDLPGFGRLRVQPGGGVGRLAKDLAAREAAVAGALTALGQPTRAAAAAALAERTAAEAELREHDAMLRVLAPEGVAALRRRVEALVATAASAGGDEGAVPSEDTIAASGEARAAARQVEESAETAARTVTEARETAAHDAVRQTERAAAAAQERDTIRAALAEARAAADDEALQGALAGAERAAALVVSALTTAAATLAAAEPEAARLTHAAAAAAQAALQARIETLGREKRDIEIELNTLGQEGYGEQLAEVEQQLESARRRFGEMTVEAEASRLLHRTLQAARQDSKHRWLGPVRDRVQPYLGLIQPGGSLVLNETTFGIEHLVRAGVSETFDSLSVGAREQVAVITRLALADILRAAGQPAAIILDDALVNTDEVRLAGMHRVLQRAAAQMQVLVLTCRAADFAALGVPIHRLVQEPDLAAEPVRRRA